MSEEASDGVFDEFGSASVAEFVHHLVYLGYEVFWDLYGAVFFFCLGRCFWHNHLLVFIGGYVVVFIAFPNILLWRIERLLYSQIFSTDVYTDIIRGVIMPRTAVNENTQHITKMESEDVTISVTLCHKSFFYTRA